MVLCRIVEVVVLVESLVAIATGDGVADELNLSRREGRRLSELAPLVEHETPELRIELITLDGIHQTHGMTAFRQSRSQGDDRVALPTESHLEGFGLVDLCHEVAALGLGNHPERGALEGSDDLDTWEIPGWSLWIGKTDAARILDPGIRRRDDTSLDGYSLNRKGRHHADKQQAE